MRLSQFRQYCLVSAFVCSRFFACDLRGQEPDQPAAVVTESEDQTEIEFAIDSENDKDVSYELSDWLQDAQPPAITFDPQVGSPDSSSALIASIFGSDSVDESLLSQTRQARAMATNADIVLGAEGRFRVATDGGSLLGKSTHTRGVAIQKRNPIVSDPRIRGDRVGRLVASGSYWFPARQDLDTMLNKIDSRLIENMIVIKGPYSARYGPGFDFVDFQLTPAPRYDGYNWEGNTSVEYQTNGEQLYGRQMVMGGDADYGYRVSYGHRTGNDYETGNGSRLPSSYNSRDLDLALGYDLTDDSSLEFNYLRLDQTGVEFPGLVYDINALVTNGFSTTYTVEDQAEFDLLTVEGWFNSTRFNGDTFGAGKNRQIPSLVSQLSPFNLPAFPPFFPGTSPGSAITDVDAYSSGYRLATSWGDADVAQTTLGTDLIYLGQQLNDIENPTAADGFPTANYPIPRSHSEDIGLFAEETRQVTDQLHVNLGGRLDFVRTDSRETAPDFFDYTGGGNTTYSGIKEAGLEQHFTLWSLYATTAYEINSNWTATAGAGHGQRPPTMTELYASGSFIGSLQPGLTALEGDPELKPEKRTQLDLGLRGDLGETRLFANAFHAWINDYIVFEYWNFNDPFYVPTQSLQQIVLGNTDLATFTGFELAVERDLHQGVTAFGSLSYVNARDQTVSEATRLGAIRRANSVYAPTYTPNDPRSGVTGTSEQLPGIVPMEARVGLRWREPVSDPGWGLELEARIVAKQDQIATSLYEIATPGFTIWNMRGFWRPYDDLTIIAGVQNFGNRYYREHLDYRSGLGVYQPGSSFYMSTELTY
ncbi:MAG: TonB-dependent receptor [Planctomycetaceae bacterium]|nr:TonB-dependent receptor [Planctomycetales bacterium]MCA9146017.1 TonB-dependent receptor [Planctomycetales bacterium]MCB9872917.1 TonB-dependent receptor [Planctomycetaceae bacterium]MCB9937507.1 TonB-dependent receptor [Planctomycetaceae bacterium]